jgi:hypothetical protein
MLVVLSALYAIIAILVVGKNLVLCIQDGEEILGSIAVSLLLGVFWFPIIVMALVWVMIFGKKIEFHL